MTTLIRPEGPDDADTIEAVVITAFESGPVSSGTEQFIVRALRCSGHLSLSLVAETDGRVVGHIAASPVTLNPPATGWYGLGPLAVLPARQRQGIGSQLVQRCLAELRATGARGCMLVGDPAYYGRFGFRAEPSLVLAGVPPQYFQALAFDGEMPAGEVTFDPAFTATA
jgi:predicted N-acetyltransferase YhbS